MTDKSAGKSVRIPGPDHPITITPQAGRVVVTVAGRVIADTRRRPDAHRGFVPAGPVHSARRRGYVSIDAHPARQPLPYKGDAAYYNIPAGGTRTDNAVWTYESPHQAVAQIAGHLAFYPDRVDRIHVTL